MEYGPRPVISFRSTKYVLLQVMLILLYSASAVEGRHPVAAQNGMVVSVDRIASAIGCDILQKGGNAVDAAVAVGFALAVTYPEAGNIGGGGFMVIRLPDGTVTTFDFRETAPLKASRNMYLDENNDVDRQRITIGHLAAGVPGSVAGFALAHERYGSLPWKTLLKPAVQIAERGFPVSKDMHENLADKQEKMLKNSAVRSIFFSDGNPLVPGARLIQKDLGNTLQRIAESGKDGFYTGITAHLIEKDMQNHGGLISKQDLAAYEARERAPVTGRFRTYTVYSMPPPSSGGVALIQFLNIFEHFELSAWELQSVDYAHLFAEAAKYVFADRAEWLGDPDYFEVSIDRLLSKQYADALIRSIRFDTTRPSAEIKEVPAGNSESEQTTHYSVIDKDDMAVACTTTLNATFGACVAVEGAGFLLNNEMDDFSAKPGEPNMYGLLGSEANAIEPSKRMLSSMSPTICTGENGFLLSIGAPGGPKIITAVLQALVNLLDYGMNIQEAVEAPRLHHQWLPDILLYEKGRLNLDTQMLLSSKGHILQEEQFRGNVLGIVRESGSETLMGGIDPRKRGSAIGY